MRVRALRGVCIGVDRHLAVGDIADLEPATVQFLKSIGAVEDVKPPPPPAPEPTPTAESEPAAENTAAAADEAGQKSPAAKAGKKEK